MTHEEAKCAASEAKAQHAAAKAAVWAEELAHSLFEVAIERLSRYGLATVSRFEAERLTECAMEYFTAGQQVEGLALRAEAQRAQREAEEAEREEQCEEAQERREQESSFESLHEQGECHMAVAIWGEPCRFCLGQRRLMPLLTCAKKMPLWG